jgi:hypothetical protein
MQVREATAEDWPAIWPILRDIGIAGETLTWDPARTAASARPGWMREPPGRTVVAVDDEGTILGSANTHPVHSGAGDHVANAGYGAGGVPSPDARLCRAPPHVPEALIPTDSRVGGKLSALAARLWR